MYLKRLLLLGLITCCYSFSAAASDISIMSTNDLLKYIEDEIDSDFNNSKSSQLSERELAKLYQERLNASGCPVGKVDGVIGTTTKFAYDEYCRTLGISCKNSDFKDKRYLANFKPQRQRVCKPLATLWNGSFECESGEKDQGYLRAKQVTVRSYTLTDEDNAVSKFTLLGGNAAQLEYNGLKVKGKLGKDRRQFMLTHSRDDGLSCTFRMIAER